MIYTVDSTECGKARLVPDDEALSEIVIALDEIPFSVCEGDKISCEEKDGTLFDIKAERELTEQAKKRINSLFDKLKNKKRSD
ncbi:MAG: DUF3006 family protein [Clostridia bacterium]|nr:DUF3006 family protein [Clostridia bacterium]